MTTVRTVVLALRRGFVFGAAACTLVVCSGCGDSQTGSDDLGLAPVPAGQTPQTPIPGAGTPTATPATPGVTPATPTTTPATPVASPPGAGDMVAGTGGVGAGDMAAGTGGTGAGGMDGSGDTPAADGACTAAPSASFSTMVVTGTGPGGNYTIARPTTLGEGGFLHPPVAWGNGLGTTPSLYTALLEDLASNGFVVIANPGTGSDPQVVREGLEWLLAQNASGDYAGKLAVDCAGTIGYSMGGGAAVGSGSHPAVKAIVSIHGLQDAAEKASGPILLTTSEGDTFVTKSGFVEPCYSRSSVQPTILASHAAGDHLDPIGAGGEDAAPAIAWLRYWIYGDQAQREWFFGDDCKLCSWPDFRRKNHPEWD